jgi:ribosome maturation factor RimP
MNPEEFKEKIDPVLKSYGRKWGIELVDFSIKSRARGESSIIEIIADRAQAPKLGQGGITIDECAQFNVYVTKEIEMLGLGDDYEVQVSSPGLDRPLKTERDFLRVVGKDVRFHLREPIEEKREYSGTVKQVMHDQVVINSKVHAMAIPFTKISKAVQVI